MDSRIERAQQLFWEIEAVRQNGVYPAALAQLLEMARLHEEGARELLQAGNSDGWTDLFAAVTAWGEARQRSEADRLLAVGRGFAVAMGPDNEGVGNELHRLAVWLDTLSPASQVPPTNGAASLPAPIRKG